jgi:hypothetical protein
MSETKTVRGVDFLRQMEGAFPGSLTRAYQSVSRQGYTKLHDDLAERKLEPFAQLCGVKALTGRMVEQARGEFGMVAFRQSKGREASSFPSSSEEAKREARVSEPPPDPQPVLPLQEDHEGEFASVKRMLGGIIGRLEKIGERVERLESGALPFPSPVPVNGKEERHA